MLVAETPQEWIDILLLPPMRALDPRVDERTRPWLTVAELLADDAAHLRLSHRQILTGSGATPAAAVKWLVGWYPGRLAHAVGYVYVYAFASAAVVLDPHRLRFGPHLPAGARIASSSSWTSNDPALDRWCAARGHLTAIDAS